MMLRHWLRYLYETPVRLQTRFISKVLPLDAWMIQIGANDGVSNDPLHPILKSRKETKAILVEPIQSFYQQLQILYKDFPNQIHIVQAAINDGKRESFYFVQREKVLKAGTTFPEWVYQLGSFRPDNLTDRFDGKLTPFIESIEIEGIRLADLIQRFEIPHFDLLHIDAEGYDYLILKQCDLKRYHPKVILYEFANLSDNEMTLAKAQVIGDYDLFLLGDDCLCIRKDLLSDKPLLKVRFNISTFFAGIVSFLKRLNKK